MTDQLRSLRLAAPTINAACQFVTKALRPGITEREISTMLITFLRSKGFSSLAFPPIIAFGSNAAYPHHKPGNRKLKPNQIVLVDFGFKIHGWCTDLTRTYFFGKPDKQFKRIYALVLKAQLAAIKKLAISRNGNTIDAAARAVITQAGYGRNFRHSTGHAVGKKIHQPPWLSSVRKRNITPKENDVVTIEPGIYIKGWGGVRIEDMVFIGKKPLNITTGIPK